MVAIKQFWSPCFWYDEVKKALVPIAFYTITFSVIMITYTCYVMNGGESSQYYMPYFETDKNTTLPWVGSLVIIFLLLLITASVLMVHGFRHENRGMMLPWLFLVSVILMYQLWMGLWLLYSYYIYLETVMVVLVNWLWMSYNIYVWLAVYSMYQEIRDKQMPTFVYLY